MTVAGSYGLGTQKISPGATRRTPKALRQPPPIKKASASLRTTVKCDRCGAIIFSDEPFCPKCKTQRNVFVEDEDVI
jgi:uncharacterized OB-fold protein